MAKNKSSKDKDQPELPLDAAPLTPAAPPGPKGERAEAIESPKGSAPSDAAPPPKRKKGQKIEDDPAPLAQHYLGWFLDYASYVILDRAVPHIDDGLKPVQRRILHTLWEMDDGRFHKVANVAGAAMRSHPHGDASIGAALVSIG